MKKCLRLLKCMLLVAMLSIFCVLTAFADEEVKPNSITINEKDVVLEYNETKNLSLNVVPGNASTSVIWKTSNSGVAEINANGVITAKGAGTAIITVISNADPSIFDTTIIVVREVVTETNIPATGLTIQPTTITLEEGASYQLSPIFTPFNVSDRNCTWMSSKPSVASVTASGMVQGQSNGNAIITAISSSGVTATCNVTVELPVTKVKGIELNKDYLDLDVDDSYTLKVTFNPSDATNKKFSFDSDDSAVASVTSKGVVRAKKKGTAIITCTSEDGSFTAECEVDVSGGSSSSSSKSSNRKNRDDIEEDIESKLDDNFEIDETQIATGGMWVKLDGLGWFFWDTDKSAFITGWRKISNKWYYFTDKSENIQNGPTTVTGLTGKMMTGWVLVGDNWYYCNGSGHLLTDQWIQGAGGEWYYVKANSGEMVKGWLLKDNVWYYADEASGAMVSGWKQVGDKWYYLDPADPKHPMKTGWVQIADKYYLLNNATGERVIGWVEDNAKNRYYLDAVDGHMLVNTVTPDGYRVNEHGVAVGKV